MSLIINHFYRFGEFTIDADQRILLREGKPVPLAPKVFETLLMLVENSGRIVAKDELMRRIWPDTFVEESNLTYSIRQLRKVLDDNARSPSYIETVPRRGYRFVANVEELLSDTTPNARIEVSQTQSTLSEKNQQSGAIEIEFHRRAVSHAGSTLSTSAKAAILVALTIILVGAAFAVLKFSSRHTSDVEQPGFHSSTLVPLRLEKLTGTGQSGLVAISPDGKYLAYTHTIKKEPGIWLRDLATNSNVEIIPPSGPVYDLAFANNGQLLYFVKGSPIALYRVPLLGGVPAKIADRLLGKFSISFDDTQVVFVRGMTNSDGQTESSLVIANVNGTNERTLFKAVYPYKLDAPLWSPDGEKILCSYGSEGSGLDMRIIEVSVADGAKREPTSARFFRIAKMAWLPDKTALIISARHLGDSNQLWRVSYPGMEVTQITEGLSNYRDLSVAAGSGTVVASQATRVSDIWVGTSRDSQSLKKITQAIDNFCWTPDGRLVYSSTESGNRDLWIMQPNGAEQRQLTVNAGVNGTPAVTPDNRYIVFVSNRSGVFQIWRMNIDGTNQLQLSVGESKNYPAVSHDGRWVLYNSTDGRLWRQSIDGGEPVALTDYPASQPSISPDGKLIACAGKSESNQPASILVMSFEGGQLLKRFDCNGFGSRLQWAPDGKALIYAADHGGVTALTKQPLNGGRPEEISVFDEQVLFDFGYSADTRSLAVTRGGWQHDIVLISDLSR